ncbi:ABC transporter substrate-binding protein [Candidatus Poribacteria bacterium]|nr:ABC transporter substrate-binding protein [Candidatus Poribacteria bacterium]
MNIRRFTTFTFVLAIVTLIAGLSACDQIGQLLIPTTPQMEGLSGEIPIGVVLPITGRLAAIGLRMGEGFELAREEINRSRPSNVRIKFIIEDDETAVEGAVRAFNKLIHQDGVPAILGPASSSAAREAFPIAQQNGVVALSPTSGASGLSAIGGFVFRASLTADVVIPHSVKVTHTKLGYQRVVTIVDSVELVARNSDKVWREALTESGVEILATEIFQSGDTDLSEQLTRIKNLNPDAIFISALPTDMPDIMIQARELGIPYSIPFIVAQVSADEVRAAGDAAEGLVTSASWISTADTPGNQVFVQNYTDKYGVEPSIWAAQSYASVYILAEAIADAQSTDSTAIRDAMANLSGFDTVLGHFSFNALGDTVYDPIMLIVKDGEFHAFE